MSTTHGEVHAEKEHGVLRKFLNKHILKQPESYEKKKNYIFGKTLGAGSFGVVRQGRRLHPREDIAIKILLKDALNEKNLNMLYDELQILELCHHENIVAFKDWFESRDKFFIVTQLAIGGELFERIVQRGSFTENDAISIIKQILKALEYLHGQDIVHRDLKPENILYLNKEDDKIVLADFGIAKKLGHSQDLIFKGAGSMGYVAPEVLTNDGHGKPCDIWSLGVITYSLLSGYSPFVAESAEGFLQEVLTGPEPVVFHAPYWNSISKEAKNFILKCCTIDPRARPTAHDLLNEDSWINFQTVSSTTTTTTTTTTSTKGEDLLPQIKKSVNPKLKLQKAIQLVIFNNKIQKLKAKYDIVEDDHDLDNTFDELKSGGSDSNGSNTPSTSRASTINSPVESYDTFHGELEKLSLKTDENSKKLKKDITQAAFANLVEFATLQKDLILKEDAESEKKTHSNSNNN